MPITAHRAIESLQIAVNDEGQVVELFARSEREASDGLWLVHFAITKDAPDVTLQRALLQQAACLQIANKSRLIDRIQRPQPHRPSWKLPESWHQPRVWVGAQAITADFLSIVRQLLLAQSTLQKCPRINTGRGVRLKVDKVTALAIGTGAKKVVESDFENLCGRGIARDMTAQFAVRLIRPRHHCEGIPAHDCRQALFNPQVAWVGTLPIETDRVPIGRERLHMRVDA